LPPAAAEAKCDVPQLDDHNYYADWIGSAWSRRSQICADIVAFETSNNLIKSAIAEKLSEIEKLMLLI